MTDDRAPLEASEKNAATRAEAGDVEPRTSRTPVEFQGVTYSVDTDGDGWPLAASRAFSRILNLPDDQPMRAIDPMCVFLEAVLPPAQWATFERTARTIEMRGLFDAVLEQAFRGPAGE